MKELKPCRSPYCECVQGECTHPGFYDARHITQIMAGAEIHSGDGGYSIGTQEKYEEFVKKRNGN